MSQVLPLNGGAPWFYELTRNMNYGQRVIARGKYADPREGRKPQSFDYNPANNHRKTK